MRRLPLVVALVLTGCTSGPPEPGEPEVAGSPLDGRVVGVLDGTRLTLEVSDTADERAVGLMGRTEVPAGTGMVFTYDGRVSDGRYYMYRVPIPLRATFIRDGKVVSTVVMPPCPAPVAQDCPTYGADAPYDTVVETDPAVAPDPQPGDLFVLKG